MLGTDPESIGTDRLVGIFRHHLGIPKAMFLSWLTIFSAAFAGNACESALSSQEVRFAHISKRRYPASPAAGTRVNCLAPRRTCLPTMPTRRLPSTISFMPGYANAAMNCTVEGRAPRPSRHDAERSPRIRARTGTRLNAEAQSGSWPGSSRQKASRQPSAAHKHPVSRQQRPDQ